MLKWNKETTCDVVNALEVFYVWPVGGNVSVSQVEVKVGAVDRLLALLTVDKVVRENELPYSLGSPRCFPKEDDCGRWFPFLLRQRINDGNKDEVTCRNFEYKTDLASAMPPYSRETRLHGRKVKSDESDMVGHIQTQDYRLSKSI